MTGISFAYNLACWSWWVVCVSAFILVIL